MNDRTPYVLCSDDGLDCMRGIINACLIMFAAIAIGLVLATAVCPDTLHDDRRVQTVKHWAGEYR